MAATSNDSSSDEEVVAKFLALASSHKRDNKVKIVKESPSSLNDCKHNYFAFPISYREEEEESQEENDSSDDCSSLDSTNVNVEKMNVHDYIVKFESSRMKNKRELKRLKEEKLELSTHVDHLSEQVERSKKIKDKLIQELDLSNRNED